MARSRNIKPGFFLNDQLAEVEPLGRLLFAGLWTVADREGRLEDRPKRIKVEVLPYDNCDVDHLLDELHKRNFIKRYEVDGERYIQITNWHKHQNPHCKEKKSIIPAPDLHGAKTVQGQPKEQTDAPTADGEKNEPEPKTLENTGQSEASEKHSTSTVQEPETHITSPADSFNLIPDSFNLIPSSSDAPKNEVDEEKMQAIIDYYCTKKGIGEPLSPLEYQSIKNIAELKEVTLDQVKDVIDYAVERKKKKFTFAYCETIIINRLEEEKEAIRKKVVPMQRRSDKQEQLPQSLRWQLDASKQESQEDPADLEDKQASIQAKLRLMDERLKASRQERERQANP
ncbi:hypothetical protein [Laceyella putida]|uniref:DnaB/C C-terminal domain-containing protein n=1 Tax=Laceyella putida TaxID=110101 RepID=A0ABW2RQE7_9BACL